MIAAIGFVLPQPVTAEMRAALIDQVEDIDLPSPPGAHEPSLTSHNGVLYTSWIEHEGDRTKVMMGLRSAQGWSEPRLVHQGSDLFVNWADFPGIAVFDDGAIAVHWLREIGPSSFDYQVEVALSRDGGTSWSKPLIPHEDRSFAQHGFVSMLPAGADGLAVIWLDGRAYGADRSEAFTVPDAMQLRATTLTSDGSLGRDVALDVQTCSCCQTNLAATGNGTILAAYRDRTDGEIRDISVARLTVDGWQRPVTVHHDGWELAGCPVNGPAIAADGDHVAVAWFTGANDLAAVKVAFSGDAGRSFGAPVRVDLGNPMGRVDVELLEDGTALVSWVEWTDGKEVLMLCRAEKESGCVAQEMLATNSAGASVNFPTMARLGRDIFIAWTQPDGTGDRIAMRRIRLTEID
ncbi:exo-alpha-sialidase [Falsiruegeria mediterranea]|uniref:exo-alpha-sialidase n=1 Tax=Falsiruegeria mediterranea TaxID=1280832 RepID=UPI0014029484|nr:exo-alpha-sialidase [Falsiruegeria mediterranea]